MYSSSSISVEPEFCLTLDLPCPIGDLQLSSSSIAVFESLLEERHLEEFRASGISDELIAACGVRTVPGWLACQRLGWTGQTRFIGDGWAIPFDDPKDRKCLWRVKLDQPRRNEEGDVIKYEQPIGAPSRVYVPPGVDLSDRDKLLLITEGEKKALSAVSRGFDCLGLTGVWNWQKKRPRNEKGHGYGQRRLIPDLANIDWKDRQVVIVLDSDAAAKPQVLHAEIELGLALVKRGAVIRTAQLPGEPDGSKNGLDDFLVRHGVEAFRNLLVAAEAVERPKLKPLDLARLWIEMCYLRGAAATIRCWRGELYVWTGTHYRKPITGNDEFKHLALKFLDKIGYDPTPRRAAEVVDALKAEVLVRDTVELPVWLQEHATGDLPVSPTCPLVAFQNGIGGLSDDVISGKSTMLLRPHTPRWFDTSAREFRFDPAALYSLWEQCLTSTIDTQSIDLLQRWFGYCITPDTSLQGVLLLIGAPRSGKGLITRMLTRMVGVDAVATPSLSELAGPFGLWPLLGKKLAILGDAHVAGRDVSALERLKLISGEDRVDVARKNLPTLNGVRLPVRFVLVANELPALHDPSGALATRISLIRFSKSFAGQEDRSLDATLAKEASGVFNWALRGLARLRAAGGFNRPASSQDMLDTFVEQASGLKAFVDEYCDVGPNFRVETPVLYAAVSMWAQDGNLGRMSPETLGKRLRAVLPNVTRGRASGANASGTRPWEYVDVGLNGAGQELAKA